MPVKRQRTWFMGGMTAVIAVAALAVFGVCPGSASEEGRQIEKVTLEGMPLSALEAFPGVSNGFLLGSFGTEGLYAAQGVMQRGAVFPPHAHPDVRLTVVVSGTMYLGEGESFDESALVAYPEGTVAITPAGTLHFMAALDGEVSVLEIGSGPSGATFPASN